MLSETVPYPLGRFQPRICVVYVGVEIDLLTIAVDLRAKLGGGPHEATYRYTTGVRFLLAVEHILSDLDHSIDPEIAKTSIQRTAKTDRSPPVGTGTPLGQVAAKSTPPPRNLVAADWRDFYEERAAILEHDGGLTRQQADRLAYEATVAGLSNAMPINHPHDRCAACGSHLGPQQGLPLADTAVVCDNTCQTRHMQRQRERAETALGKMGVCLNC